ncbi:MAG: 2,3-bisphosphoglycerate-independent phosphoglycerate mutase [Anaerolineales bacterium]|nr:2,3-bisphosphoglycerate-independent phosphoglycerate mutase [Anaerolineales bacterium]
MRLLFLFLDGIGLGADDPQSNPFARANTPFLHDLLGGHNLTASAAPFEGERVSLLALDAGLGVDGLPQSATGQAVLLTGVNIPKELGYHYGPKPNPEVAAYLRNGHTLFSWLRNNNQTAALLNAYPPRYFEGIDSGKRLFSSIPLALTNAGLPLFTHEDFFAGRALSADFTGHGWHDFLGFPDAPLLSPQEAGRKTAGLAAQYDFSLFEYWASDYAGHKQDMDWAVRQLEALDGVLHGLLEAWDDNQGLILLTSDHGNMEDLSTRRHTDARVPLLVIGKTTAREQFTRGMADLTHVAPGIWRMLGEV